MKKVSKFVNPYIVFLIFVLAILAATNYTPGTFLTGWDNHHPEFNPGLYLERSLTSVWQGWAGLGMIGGIAFAADLPRVIIVWILSLFLPIEYIRYISTFGALFIGAIGIFVLAKTIIFAKIKSERVKNSGALAASMFYVFNLGTLQIFYTPIETFVYAFAFIPWIIWSVLNYFEKPTYKNALKIFILSFLGTPMALTPTTYMNVALILGVIFLAKFFSYLKSRKKTDLRAIFFAGITIIAANAFWVLPTMYAIPSKSDIVPNSKIGRIASPDIRDLSESFQNWEDFPVFKSFWFKQQEVFIEQNQGAVIGTLVDDWFDYTNSPIIYGLGIFMFTMCIFGIVITAIKRKEYKYIYVPLSGLLIGSFMLLGSSPPLGFLYDFTIKNISFLSEVFRLAFTKFIYITLLGFSIFFAITVLNIVHAVEKQKLLSNKWPATIILIIAVSFPLLIYMVPAFNGNFILAQNRVKIPDEYFEAFEWFETLDPDKKVLSLPANTYIGWQYYEWGYRGSGFLWYGIPQPILDRAFDTWSVENERAYLEISNAIYTEDKSQFEKLIEKYNIGYLLLDENIIEPQNKVETLFMNEIKSFLVNNNKFTRIKSFDEISVYQFNNNNSNIHFDSSIQSTNKLSDYTYNDLVYTELGNYIDDPSRVNKIFPFDSLEERSTSLESYANGVLTFKNNIKIEQGGDFIFKPEFPIYSNDKTLVDVVARKVDSKTQIYLEAVTPELYVNSEQVYEQFKTDIASFDFQAENFVIVVNDQPIEVTNISETFGNIGNLFIDSTEDIEITIYTETGLIDIYTQLVTQKVNECFTDPTSESVVDKGFVDKGFTLISKNSIACNFYFLNQLDTNIEHLLKLKYDYEINGALPDVCVRNKANNECLYTNEFTFNQSSGQINDFIQIPVLPRPAAIEFFGEDLFYTDDQSGQVTYKNIILSEYTKKTDAVNVSFETPKVKVVEFDDDSEITFELRIRSNTPKTIFEDLIIERGYNKTINCGNSSDKSMVDRYRNSDSIFFISTDASSCDFLIFKTIDSNLNYLLLAENKYIEGQALRMYFNTRTSISRNIQFVTTDFNRINNYSTAFIPISTDAINGYTLFLENKSLGPTTSANVIDSLTFIPIPADLITTLKFERYEKENENVSAVQLEKTRLSPTKYLAHSTSNTEGYIIFNQTYATGWKAYRFDSEPGFLGKLLPSIFGGENVDEHHKANNWANAWKIDEDGYYLITFQPQILEEVGLMVFAVALIFICYKTAREKDRKKRNIVYNDYDTSELIYR